MVAGTPIYEFREISSFEESTTEYLMPLAQRDKYVHTSFNSRIVELPKLTQQISQQVSSAIHERFGTMAYKDMSSFASADHQHTLQYSNIRNENIKLCSEDGPDIQLLGRMFVNGQLSNIYYDKTKNGQTETFSYDLIEPRIGTLKFKPGVWSSYIDITKEDFDGWVYANGQTYNTEDFVNQIEISTTLSVLENGTKFVVPSIGNSTSINYIKAKNDISVIQDAYTSFTFNELTNSTNVSYAWNLPTFIYVGLSKWSK